MIEAAHIVLQHNPKIIFLFVGSGDQKIHLLSRAAQLGISSNVIFVDFQNGKKLKDAYSIGDLFVMPSVSEPFGLGALEAIGLGTPSIISYQSGVAEVIANVLKVDFWDINEMANQIVAVTRYNGLRDELQKNSYKEFKSQSWATAAEETKVVYSKAIGAPV